MVYSALAGVMIWMGAAPEALALTIQRGWISGSGSSAVRAVPATGGGVANLTLRRVITSWPFGSSTVAASAPFRLVVPALPRVTYRPAAPAPGVIPAGPAPAAGLTADEQRMLDLVNRARAAQGLAPLAVDMRLVETARLKSRDMVEKGYFGHVSPTYGTVADMWRRAGISFAGGGENIAGAPTVDMAFNNLMNSPGHRANILNPAFTHIGIGIVDGGPYGKMITQQFIIPR